MTTVKTVAHWKKGQSLAVVTIVLEGFLPQTLPIQISTSVNLVTTRVNDISNVMGVVITIAQEETTVRSVDYLPPHHTLQEWLRRFYLTSPKQWSY